MVRSSVAGALLGALAVVGGAAGVWALTHHPLSSAPAPAAGPRRTVARPAAPGIPPALPVAAADPAAVAVDRQVVGYIQRQVARQGYPWFQADGGQLDWRREHDPAPATVAPFLRGLPPSGTVQGVATALATNAAEWQPLAARAGLTPSDVAAAVRVATAAVLANSGNAPLTGLLFVDGSAQYLGAPLADSFVPAQVKSLVAPGPPSLADRAYVYRLWVTVHGVGLKDPPDPYVTVPPGQRLVATAQVNLTVHVVQADAPPGRPLRVGLFTQPVTVYVDAVQAGSRRYWFTDLIGVGPWSGPAPVYLTLSQGGTR